MVQCVTSFNDAEQVEILDAISAATPTRSCQQMHEERVPHLTMGSSFRLLHNRRIFGTWQVVTSYISNSVQ